MENGIRSPPGVGRGRGFTRDTSHQWYKRIRPLWEVPSKALCVCLSLSPPTLLPSLQRGSTTSLAIGSCSHCAHIRHARDTSRSPDVPFRLREHLKNTLCHVSADFPGHCVWLPLRPHSQDCGEWYRVHGAVAKVLGLLFAPALHLHHLHTQKFTYVRV
jgi:hypothetical protein